MKKICTNIKSQKQKLTSNTTHIKKERKIMPGDTNEYQVLHKKIRKEVRKNFNTITMEIAIENNRNMKVFRSKLLSGNNRIFNIKYEQGQATTARGSFSIHIYVLIYLL